MGLAVALAGCSAPASDGQTYTLYRESVSPAGEPIERVHVATFDANQSGDYNRYNCFTARDLFQGQPGVTVRYWCELGTYRAR